MAVIDTLTLNLTTQTAGLSKGLKQSTSLISNFANTLKGPLGQISALFAGAFSVNALKDFVLSGIDAADVMEHVADTVGLTAEAFNQLRHAGAITDVTQAQLVAGLERMQRTIGEAGMGIETANEAFEQIGISVEALRALTPDQQFKMIANAIHAIKDPSEKAAAAVDIFGKSGQKLIPLLDQGEAGLNALGKEVEGAFSDEKRKGLKAANDALDIMGEAFVSMKHEVAVALAPAVREIADIFKDWLKTLKEIVALFQAINAPPDVGPPVQGPPSRGWFEGVNWTEVLTRVLTGNASSVGGLLGAGGTATQDQVREAVKEGMSEAVAALKALADRPAEPGVEL